MCSSVRTIASLSFHAATTMVTGGHSPSGQSPLGGSSGSSWYRVIRSVKIMNPIDEAGDVGEEDRNHPAHDRADRSLKLTPPWLGHPDAERHPCERQCERDREANCRPQAQGRSLAPCQTT